MEKLKEILNDIERFDFNDNAYKLKDLVLAAIHAIEHFPQNETDELFKGKGATLTSELKHTLNKEVDLFIKAKTVKDKKHHLNYAKMYLLRDIKLYFATLNL